MVTPPNPRKWRKSLFSFGINWPTKSSMPTPSPPISPLDSNCRSKRHNSIVTFAPSPPQSHPSNYENIAEKPQIQRQLGYSTQSCRSNHPFTASKFGHQHGSVQSLVNRQKIQQKSSMPSTTTTTTMPSVGSTLSRRPSTPSMPLAIVQAVTGRIRKGSSTFSLDEGDSAFYSTDDSACSTASLSSSPGKRNSEISINVSEPSRRLPFFLSEWTEEDEEEMEKRFANSISYQFVKHYKRLAWSHLPMMKEEPKVEESNILYAEGEVQFQLLSMVAPPGKHVVKVFPTKENWRNMSYAELINRKLK